MERKHRLQHKQCFTNSLEANNVSYLTAEVALNGQNGKCYGRSSSLSVMNVVGGVAIALIPVTTMCLFDSEATQSRTPIISIVAAAHSPCAAPRKDDNASTPRRRSHRGHRTWPPDDVGTGTPRLHVPGWLLLMQSCHDVLSNPHATRQASFLRQVSVVQFWMVPLYQD